MALTPNDVDRIAHLARLALTDAQSEQLLTKLNGFFDLVQAMSEVDTQGVEPLAHPVAVMQDVALRLRDDVVTDGAKVEAVLSNAPKSADGFFVVPKVVE